MLLSQKTLDATVNGEIDRVNRRWKRPAVVEEGLAADIARRRRGDRCEAGGGMRDRSVHRGLSRHSPRTFVTGSGEGVGGGVGGGLGLGSAPEDSPRTAVSKSPVLTCWRSHTTPRSVVLDIMGTLQACDLPCRGAGRGSAVPTIRFPSIPRPYRERVGWKGKQRETLGGENPVRTGVSGVFPGQDRPHNRAHNPKVAGSNPAPATNETSKGSSNGSSNGF